MMPRAEKKKPNLTLAKLSLQILFLLVLIVLFKGIRYHKHRIQNRLIRTHLLVNLSVSAIDSTVSHIFVWLVDECCFMSCVLLHISEVEA